MSISFPHHRPRFDNGSLSRRDLLHCMAGAGVSFLLPALDARAANQRGAERPRSLITLWMNGGLSQLEFWDPHPALQQAGPSELSEIKTTIPGLQISSLLPRMAEQMHHLNLIRSMVSKEGDHERGTYFGLTGYRPDPTFVHPSLGAILANKLPDDRVQIPTHVSLGSGDGFTMPRGGYLGDEWDAFRVVDPGHGTHNMQPPAQGDRMERRLQGLKQVNNAFRQGRELQTERTLHEQMFDRARTMMNSDQLRAFDLKDEPAETIQRYGNSRFGRGCLVARRLVEQGVRSVQVVLSGFDSHVNNFNTQQARAKDLDPAMSALIADLVERDLFASTVVLCMSEFGRTPRINPLEGRDHWPTGFSCVVGGGGLASGVVIGQTRPDLATDPGSASQTTPKDPVQVPDLIATVLNQMGLDPAQQIVTPIGRPVALAEGKPITALLAR